MKCRQKGDVQNPTVVFCLCLSVNLKEQEIFLMYRVSMAFYLKLIRQFPLNEKFGSDFRNNYPRLLKIVIFDSCFKISARHTVKAISPQKYATLFSLNLVPGSWFGMLATAMSMVRGQNNVNKIAMGLDT